MDIKRELKIVSETPAMAHIDAGNGLGQYTAHEGMNLCLKKAHSKTPKEQ